MTRLMQFANNATSRLAANLSAVGTTITVIPGDGAKFPALSAGQYFMATLVKADGTKEVVKVTARSTDTLTVVRAAEAVAGVQTSYSFTAADRIELRLTAGELASELDRLDKHALMGVLNKSANYTVLEADVSTLIRVDSSAAARTITLPLISSLTEDFIVAIAKVSNDSNAVYIAGSGGNTINGTTPYALVSQWQGAWLVADRTTNTWTAVSSGVGSSFVFVDKFTGTGSQTDFTLTAGVYSSNQVDVTISGVTQNPGIDYTATGTTLTFTTAPPNATVILARYTQSSPQVATGTCTIERQVATAGQTGFALANGYVPGSNTMQVFVNGLLMSVGSDYTETGANSVLFGSGLSVGDEVQFVVYGETISSAEASNVGYLPAGTGAVATTVQTKLRESVSVFDFMTASEIADVRGRTLLINVLPKLQAAVAASKNLFFPDGAYFLGTQTTSAKLLDFSAVGDGITIRAGKNVELVATSSGSGTAPMCFYFKGNSRIYMEPMSFRDTGFVAVSPHIGMTAIHFDCATITADCGDVNIEAVSTNGCTAAIAVAGSSIAQTGNNTFRLRGIRVGQVHAVNGYYGVNFQANGDDLTIDNLYSETNFRALYVYGLTGVTADVYVRSNRASSGCINIATFGSAHQSTEAIRVNAKMRDNTNFFTPVLITTVNDTTNGMIRNVDVSVDVECTNLYQPVRFVNYTGSGGTETSVSSTHSVKDVKLRGVVDTNSLGIDCLARYNTKGNITVEQSPNFAVTSDIIAAFKVNGESAAYAPTWTAASVNPTIGNGTIAATYSVSNNLCRADFKITFGSTTTAGTGAWALTLPFASQQDAVGSIHILDAGTTNYTGACEVNVGSSSLAFVANNFGANVGAGTPQVWATGDYLRGSITFPIS